MPNNDTRLNWILSDLYHALWALQRIGKLAGQSEMGRVTAVAVTDTQKIISWLAHQWDHAAGMSPESVAAGPLDSVDRAMNLALEAAELLVRTKDQKAAEIEPRLRDLVGQLQDYVHPPEDD